MNTSASFTLGKLHFNTGTPGVLFTVSDEEHPRLAFKITAPSFEVNGEVRSDFQFESIEAEQALSNGGTERKLHYTIPGQPQLRLEVLLRGYPNSPFVRFQYRLSASLPTILTRTTGKDAITYFGVNIPPKNFQGMTEIQLSQWNPLYHTYLPQIVEHPLSEFIMGSPLPGPILVFHTAAGLLLMAYEHGADTPHSFLEFVPSETDGQVHFILQARQGNIYHGQPLGPEKVFESVWFELGVAPISMDEFLPRYRAFILEEMSLNKASRQPVICYNTWNYQERIHLYENRPYLSEMNQACMLAEIEAAHQVGIDVFVIDTGWYSRTGDWQVNPERFPDNLKAIRQKLEAYGMKLGLWFNPTAAALTSKVFKNHPEYEMTWDGKPNFRGPIWETEESAAMCLASGYADEFIEIMVRCAHELGVTYFKWDAVGQYGCNSPHHQHGTEVNTPEERAACFSYQMGRSMIRMAEVLSERCPGTVVDFDVTENRRFVGLGWLAAGRYFLINNGPYLGDADIPERLGMNPWFNLFFHPGPARARMCRQGCQYDDIIPSSLFLTHYLPDPPTLSQHNNLASLVLGGNGIWGDLPNLDGETVDFWQQHMQNYKSVLGHGVHAYPRHRGMIGSSPEIHEKIDPKTGSGLITFFTVTPTQVDYLTQPLDINKVQSVLGADDWSNMPDGRLKIRLNLARDEARTVFIFSKKYFLRNSDRNARGQPGGGEDMLQK